MAIEVEVWKGKAVAVPVASDDLQALLAMLQMFRIGLGEFLVLDLVRILGLT